MITIYRGVGRFYARFPKKEEEEEEKKNRDKVVPDDNTHVVCSLPDFSREIFTQNTVTILTGTITGK